ncbi:MAG: hypothetical protein ACSLFN_04025 [Candidatus Limnocylindrales bacterium]
MAASLLLAGSLFVILAPTASAECMSWPIRSSDRPDIGYAFIATVTEASADVDPAPDMADYDWHIEMAVERTYRGQPPETLSYNGWDVGCHFLRGDHLRTGDRLFIATERIADWGVPSDPFDGDVLVWIRDDGRWMLHAKALDWGTDRDFYPRVARAARTTADIVAIVSSARLPDTATVATAASDDDRPPPASWLTMIATFLGAAFVMSRRVVGTRPATRVHSMHTTDFGRGQLTRHLSLMRHRMHIGDHEAARGGDPRRRVQGSRHQMAQNGRPVGQSGRKYAGCVHPMHTRAVDVASDGAGSTPAADVGRGPLRPPPDPHA